MRLPRARWLVLAGLALLAGLTVIFGLLRERAAPPAGMQVTALVLPPDKKTEEGAAAARQKTETKQAGIEGAKRNSHPGGSQTLPPMEGVPGMSGAAFPAPGGIIAGATEPPPPPTGAGSHASSKPAVSVICSAEPMSAAPGDAVTLIAEAASSANRPLTYIWTSSSGRLDTATGATAHLDTAGAAPGPLAAMVTVTDDSGASATCSTQTDIAAAAPPEPAAMAGAPPPEGAVAPAAPVSLQRYPAIEAPNRIAPEVEFAVMVSLDLKNIAPQTHIVQGAATAAGALNLRLPAAPAHQWQIDVILSTPGTLEISRGSDEAMLTLPESGDSTPALFHLKAPAPEPGKPAQRSEPIVATLMYQGAFLARIERDITVGAPTAVAGAVPAATPSSTIETARPAVLDLNGRRPDLTVMVMRNDAGTGLDLILDSPWLQPAHYMIPKPQGLRAWLAAQYVQLNARSARGFGSAVGAPTSVAANQAFLQGLGRQLYRAYAPAPFRQDFWKLEDELGARFRTIEIITDDPSLPWELMRPSRPDGSGERGYLGLDFDVARWDFSQSANSASAPPQSEPLDAVDVLAPQYPRAIALPAQTPELAALEALGAHRIAPADASAMRHVLADPPQGIIHFAGHGGVSSASGVPAYGILLSDGVLDLMTLRGLEPAVAPAVHPLIFFNACEVGQASAAPDFVDGWAPELLRGGASGYIGALWEVNDTVAARFSQRFYSLLEQDLASGANVGEILRQTKRELFQETGNPTALAYVFYGDPNFTFTRP